MKKSMPFASWFYFILLFTFVFAGISHVPVVYAESKTILVEGVARVGENETEVNAKERAWQDAQRKALEEAGVIIASATTVRNYKLVEDWIQTVALAKMQSKLIAEHRSFEDNEIVFRIDLECKVNTEDIDLLNEQLRKLTAPGEPKDNPAGPGAGQLPGHAVQYVKDFLLPDGSKYTGSLVNGQPDGKGAECYPDGGRYDGEFRRGLRQGSGTMVWPNGDRYTGHWLNDFRSGLGEFVNSQGKEQKGRWLNDVFFGD
ncbi:morn motif [Lucifera butyrica]|uniref:Morn motif n=1 Tax=Lucifera butyrica TaxID=1351585 RepID=A0A498R1L4_9FIRM|nr:hypothetical protein [Lucifera butyrica]VBB05334.1 morn motif [Lucifera butyrica]